MVMEPLETLQALAIAVKTLSEIEDLAIDDDIKDQLTNKVLEAIGIQKTKTRKHTPGSQDKIIESLRRLGSAIRADIVADCGLDPNVISSILSKLSKNGKIKKITLNSSPKTNGRGLEPEYMYALIEEEDIK